MAGPISVVMANNFMCKLEKDAVKLQFLNIFYKYIFLDQTLS